MASHVPDTGRENEEKRWALHLDDLIPMRSSRSASAGPHWRRPAAGSARLWRLSIAVALAAFALGYATGSWRRAGSIRVSIHRQAAKQPRSQLADMRHTGLQLRAVGQDVPAISMHTVVMTNCDRWQDWQMAGLYWSFLRRACSSAFPCTKPLPGNKVYSAKSWHASFTTQVWAAWGVHAPAGLQCGRAAAPASQLALPRLGDDRRAPD
jgi:hypothetical protein